MPFNYADFRAEYARLKRAARAREAEDDRRRANLESVHRPTEFMVALRAEAAAGRLTLTPLEKRVLYYDRQYLRRTRDVRDEYITARRAHYVATLARCHPSEVARILDRIEEIYLRCALLDHVPDDAYTPPMCRRKRASAQTEAAQPQTAVPFEA